jgi:ribose-phosphate pyrophosphokinase
VRKTGVALLSGDAHPQLAKDIAQLIGATVSPATVSAFADGETRVRIEADVQDADLYIVQPTSAPTNERLMTLALLADAARAAGASRVTAVVPYFGYARQDVRKSAGEPRSAQIAARLLFSAGIDRLVTIELHSAGLESAFQMPIVQLEADQAMLPVIRSWAIADLAVVSPDAGGLKRAQRYASALNAPVAVIAKTRPRPDVAVALQVLGAVRGRNCLIVDDLASTGGTIVAAGQALVDAGAKDIHALFIHAVMAPDALERICAGPIQRIVTTDSVRTAPHPRLHTVSLAPLLAQALTRLSGNAHRVRPSRRAS